MKRKILTSMLVVVLAISLAGCSSKKDTNSGSEVDTSQLNTEGSENSDNVDNQDSDDIPHTMYDDLQNYEKILFHDIYISVPLWADSDEVTGVNVTNSNSYVITIAYDDEASYTGPIEDILDFTYDYFTKAVGEHAITQQFDEYNLTTKEKVTLDCGAEAMKFEGTLPAKMYGKDGAVVDYYIYGYSFNYDDVTITIGATIDNPDEIDEHKDTLKDIIDRMVKTIRTKQ